jgi:predicted metal-dependent hydrolase
MKSEERRALLPNGEEIRYVLKRSSRRSTIALRIDSGGLTVNAPTRAPLYRLEAVLADKAGWVRDKLAEMLARRAPARLWRDGETLPFLGGELQLSVIPGRSRVQPVMADNRLWVETADAADAAAVKTKVVKWYRAQAHTHFAERVALYAGRLNVPVPPLALSNAASRWGSCNARGEVRLNWRLIKAAPHLIDYVVAHELAHLKHLDHSAAFWRTVALLYPGCLDVRRELKATGHLYHTF